VFKGKTIEVDVINVRDQAVKTSEDSNLCALWERDEDSAEIEFYYDDIETVYLHLAENLIEIRQILN